MPPKKTNNTLEDNQLIAKQIAFDLYILFGKMSLLEGLENCFKDHKNKNKPNTKNEIIWKSSYEGNKFELSIVYGLGDVNSQQKIIETLKTYLGSVQTECKAKQEQDSKSDKQVHTVVIGGRTIVTVRDKLKNLGFLNENMFNNYRQHLKRKGIQSDETHLRSIIQSHNQINSDDSNEVANIIASLPYATPNVSSSSDNPTQREGTALASHQSDNSVIASEDSDSDDDNNSESNSESANKDSDQSFTDSEVKIKIAEQVLEFLVTTSLIERPTLNAQKMPRPYENIFISGDHSFARYVRENESIFFVDLCYGDCSKKTSDGIVKLLKETFKLQRTKYKAIKLTQEGNEFHKVQVMGTGIYKLKESLLAEEIFSKDHFNRYRLYRIGHEPSLVELQQIMSNSSFETVESQVNVVNNPNNNNNNRTTNGSSTINNNADIIPVRHQDDPNLSQRHSPSNSSRTNSSFSIFQTLLPEAGQNDSNDSSESSSNEVQPQSQVVQRGMFSRAMQTDPTDVGAGANNNHPSQSNHSNFFRKPPSEDFKNLLQLKQSVTVKTLENRKLEAQIREEESRLVRKYKAELEVLEQENQELSEHYKTLTNFRN